jgi:4-aminobutyrate aminotransferase-like enzyme
MSPEPLKKAFLLSAGTEATEAAVKLMRLNGMRQAADKRVIVSFQGCMHGRTMGAEMLKGPGAATASWVGHVGNEICQLPFPYPWECGEGEGASRFERDMEALLSERETAAEKIAGFIIEPYQGWGAVFYPQSYIKALSAFAARHGALVCFDEIQSGFGRTGRLYAFEHYGVRADLLCLGKGLTSSLPMSAVIGRPEVMDLPGVGEMSSTHSGNPLCCAAGLANIRFIRDRALVSESERKGRLLQERLLGLRDRHPRRVSFVAGRGLVAAVLTVDPSTGAPDGALATDAVMRAFRKGLLLVHTGRESIKMGPPLVITDEALDEGLDVLDESFDEAVAAREEGER